MLQVPAIGDQPLAEDKARERAVRIQADSYYYEDLTNFGWLSIGRGIIFAGGAYPIVFAAIYVGLGIAVSLFNGRLPNILHLGALLSALFVIGVYVVVAWVIGAIWASLVTLITLPVMHLLVWSMKLRPNVIRLGAFCGGLVAFLAILPMTVQIASLIDTGYVARATIMALCGPGLATIVGQYGGARGGRNAAFRLSAKMACRRSLIALGWRPKNPDQSSDEDNAMIDEDRGRFRFRTIHLLLVGAWLSLLLTAIRLSGIPYRFILPAIFGWLVYQAATLAIGQLLVHRLGPWWRARRQIRST